MKITTRDVRLLTIGFIIGAIFTLSLVTIAPPPPAKNLRAQPAPTVQTPTPAQNVVTRKREPTEQDLLDGAFWASSFVAPGPVRKSASIRPPFIIRTNIQWQTRPLERHLPTRQFDSTYRENPLQEPIRRNMDLISMRYQPDIKVDDVK